MLVMLVVGIPQINGLIPLPFEYFLPLNFLFSPSFFDQLRCLAILIENVRHLAVYALVTIVFFLYGQPLLQYSAIGFLTLSFRFRIICIPIFNLHFVKIVLKMLLILLHLLRFIWLIFQKAIQK